MPTIRVKSELPGRVSAIEAKVGERVGEDEPLAILEAMKMEIPLAAPAAGIVTAILIRVGETIEEGQEIAVVEA